MINKLQNEELYWSKNQEDIAALRKRCRRTLNAFGNYDGRLLWGAGLYPLIGCMVMVSESATIGRLVQVLPLAGEVCIIVSEGAPTERCIFTRPEEVLLPWHTPHQKAFVNLLRKRSQIASGVGLTSRRGVIPVRPMGARTVAQDGQILFAVSEALF